jgi:peptidyl-prolyl cis-trans isomerase SurA
MYRIKPAAAAFCMTLSFAAIGSVLTLYPATAHAAGSAVVATVNGTVVTSGDVQRRVNFLRLQRAKGNLQKTAREQLINEVLEREEILKAHTSVSTDEVDAAFGRFAANNKLTIAQLSSILQQAGVGVDHFKSFIAVSISWPRAVAARYGASGQMNPGELGARIAATGQKPKVNEYVLKQIIFVIPEKKRGALLGKRRAEAEASRKKFPGCDKAKEFAATMHDVSVRDLGRFLEPQLPDNWKPLIIKAPAGGTTSTLPTQRGIEYLAICNKREVSDDAAAEITFQQEDMKKLGEDQDPNSKKYIEELRSKAIITLK